MIKYSGMVIHLSTCLEDELRRIASLRRRALDEIMEEAVRQYLDALSITDVSPEEVSATQSALAGELEKMPKWSEEE